MEFDPAEFDAKVIENLFRNYDQELAFVKSMYKLEDMKFDQAVMVTDFTMNLVGENWILVFEAVNDNRFGTT